MMKSMSWEILKNSWVAQPHHLSFFLPHSPQPGPGIQIQGSTGNSSQCKKSTGSYQTLQNTEQL